MQEVRKYFKYVFFPFLRLQGCQLLEGEVDLVKLVPVLAIAYLIYSYIQVFYFAWEMVEYSDDFAVDFF